MQSRKISDLARCGVAFTLVSSLMVPSTTAFAQPGDGSVDSAGQGQESAQSQDESLGLAQETADADSSVSYDDEALLRSVGEEDQAEGETPSGGLLGNSSLSAGDENVTIIVQLEQGNQGVSLFSFLGGSVKQDRHQYFKDQIRELAGEESSTAGQGGLLSLFSSGSNDEAESSIEELHDYYNVIDGFAVKAPASTLDDIKALDGVKNAFIETLHEIPEDQGSTGGVSNQDSLDMTGADQVEQTGEGQIIAIIDSGLDTDHEAFSGDLDDGSLALSESGLDGIRGSLSAGANATYVSEKIPFAYDYADNDSDVNPSATAGEHGTHVTGIAAANGGQIRGTAPDAQVAFMKVATDSSGSLPDSAIIAALDDVQQLGVTSINMSFGLDAGFSEGGSSTTYADAFETLENAGITLNVAAGNAYSAALGNQSGSSLPYASDPDSSMISSPAAMTDAFAVASAETETGRAYVTSGDGRQIAYSELQSSDSATVQSFEEKVADGDYAVIDGGYGTMEDASALSAQYGWDYDWSKTVILVKRGTSDGSELKLGQKAQNIWSSASSVAAVIIYNNESGEISNGATDVNLWCPALTISGDDGQSLLAEDGATITVKHGQLMPASTDYSVSSYSSWGVTPDLKLKPEITAPGGNVYSSVLNGQYDFMSGTSMATPQMTGISAQMREYVEGDSKFSGLSDSEKADIVTQLLMSTAKPLADGESSYVSPRHQGAGIANVPAATETEVYATVENAEDSSRPKADLGESADGSWSFTVTLRNLGNADHAYTLDTAALSEQVANGLFQQSSENWTGKGIDVSYSGSTYDASSGTVEVPAGDTASLTISVSCEQAFKDFVSENASNGTFVDGFALLKSVEEGGVDLSVPFMGFYGDWSSSSVFDGDLVPDEGEEKADFHIYGSVEADANGYALGLNTLDSDDADRFLAGDYSVVDKDKMVVSNMGYSTSPNALVPLTGLLRNADNLTYTYKNEEGETVLEYSYDAVRKSYYYQSQGVVTWAEAFMSPSPSFTGSDQDGNRLPEGAYTLTRTATVAGSEDTQVDDVTSFDYDMTGPEFSNVAYTGEGADRIMSFDVTDDSWLAAIDFHDPSSGGWFYRINPADDFTVNEDGSRTWHFDVSVADIEQKWVEVGVGTADEMPNTIPLYAWDYGQNPSNVSAVITPVDAESIAISSTAVSLAPGQKTQLTATVHPETTTETAVEWSSSDESVVTTDQRGNLSGVGVGTATITVSSVSNPEVKATATVTVAKVSEDVGIIMSQQSVSVEPGATTEVTALVADKFAEDEIVWSSSDETVATVQADAGNAAKATVTAGGAIGNATVTATVKTATGKQYSATMDIAVRPSNYDQFEIDENGVLLYYKGNSTYVEIPNNVTEIGHEAFQATPVQTVVVPASVKKIGDYAFRQATNLTTITFEDSQENPSQLEEVGAGLFASTSKLTEVIFPQSLKKMGEGCFASTYIEKVDFGGVTEIPVNACNYSSRFYSLTMTDKVTSIGAGAFGNTGITEINLSNTGDEARTKGWPSSLVEIGDSAFSGTGIADGNLPASIKRIGSGAFSLSGLSSVDLQNVEYVGSSAFMGTSISQIDIPDSVTSLGSGAFSQMGSLTKVSIGKNVPESSLEGLFQYSSAITTFTADEEANCTVVDNVLFSKDKATLFCYKNGMSGAYVIPEGTVRVAAAAFQQGSVTGLTFPTTLKTISGLAFNACTNLSGALVLPDGMEAIENNAFSNDAQITSVDLGGTKTLGASAFYSDRALSDVDFGTRLESIGGQAFGDGVPLVSVVMPDTLTAIGDSVFSNNAALKNIHIGAGMTAAFSMLFTGCNNVEELTVADDNPVYSAENNVLYGNVTYADGATDYYGKPLYSGKHLILSLPTNDFTELVVAEGTEYIDSQAVRNNANLQKVVLPEGMKGLYTGAFNGCDALTEVTFPKNSLEFVYGNALNGSNVDVIDFGSAIGAIDGAFMWGAPDHLVLSGGNSGSYNEGFNMGRGSSTVYSGPGMSSVSLSHAPSILVVGADVSALTIPRVTYSTDITVYAIPGTTGYATAKAALEGIGVDPGKQLKDYTQLSVNLVNDVAIDAAAAMTPTDATAPGSTVTVTASTTGGVDGDKEYRFYQTKADGTEEALTDWTTSNTFQWTVPENGSPLRVEARDATYLTVGDTLGSVETPTITDDLDTAPAASVDGNVTLTVGAQATEGATLTYQWYKDGVAIEGANAASFIPTERGTHEYHCVVTAEKEGALATANSQVATVTVYDVAAAPEITSSLVSVSVEQGSVTTLSVDATASDGGVLAYQWYKDGQPIEGATTSVYSPATDEVGQHTYRVVITNTLGIATNTATVSSGEATITVTEKTAPVDPTNPGDDDGQDNGSNQGGNDGANGGQGGSGNNGGSGSDQGTGVDKAGSSSKAMSKTGDAAPIAAVGTVGALSALVAAVAALRHRRKVK